MTERFDEAKWFGHYIGNVTIDFEKLDNIRNFVLFWSLFESIVCENTANVRSICDIVDELSKKVELSLEDYKHIYDYFRNRYTESGEVNDKFHDLKFRTRDKKELVEEVLKSEDSEVTEIVKALLIIVYRLRSNLFHGRKDVKDLYYQTENFKIANELLAKLIEKYGK